MRAVLAMGYGPPEVLEIREVETPTPGDREVRIRVRATTVSSGDWRVRSRTMPRGIGPIAPLVLGRSRPRQPILGTELAGEIDSVGREVTRFRPGEAVFAFPGGAMGSHAEYRVMPEGGAIARKPDSLSFEQAAALSFGGTTALSFLRRARLQPGERVLINGASGAVGTAAVQIAKHLGAEVTGVCGTSNLELVRSLGADRVIDYTREDFTAGGERYDLVMDTAGTAPFSRSRASLRPGGRHLPVLGSLAELLRAPWVSWTTGHRVVAGPSSGTAADLRFLAELAESGAYRPVIDRSYPFEEIREAHRYVDQGHKKGSVVVVVS